MLNYCPACGIKLEQNFKFCPSCGIDLKVEKIQNAITQKENEAGAKKVIICENCGEENNSSNSVCEGCGVKLYGQTGPGRTQNFKTVNLKSSEKPAVKESVKKQKQNQSTKTIIEEKKLDTNKILIAVAAVIAGLAVILFISGVFDNNTSPTTVQNNVTDQSSGVDLSNLNLINDLQKKADNNPDDLVTLLELAHLQNDSRLFQNAITNYKRYLDKKPEDADARIDMGVCYYSLRDYDNAIAEMTTALKYKPDHQIGHLNLGIVNLSAGNLEKSKEWLLKAVSLNPNNEVGKRAQELLQSH